MNQETKRKVLLLENDPAVLEKIQMVLEDRPYEKICFSSNLDALKASKKSLFDLIITGHNEENKDPVEVMKTFVMTSPMSSIIMVTDLSDSEVDEKAEGYGILGNIARDVPSEDLLSLLRTYEKIQQSFKQK
ncbi:MAG: response regulator [Deltaproteobacteria bacterium]|nr:response regulator [Deltaproteobacteria bacterium]